MKGVTCSDEPHKAPQSQLNSAVSLMYHSDTSNRFFSLMLWQHCGCALVKVSARLPPGEGSKEILFWLKIPVLLLPPRLIKKRPVVLCLQMLAAVSPVALTSLHILTRNSAHTHVTWTWYDTCCRNADWMLWRNYKSNTAASADTMPAVHSVDCGGISARLSSLSPFNDLQPWCCLTNPLHCTCSPDTVRDQLVNISGAFSS